MHQVSTSKDPSLSLPYLRLLVPPIRLVSAAIWHTVQHKLVSDYGLLDDFVTMVTDIVPELLNHRQRCLLSLSLRVQLLLDICRPERTVDLKTIQPHLDRMETLTSLWNKEQASDTGNELSGSNIVGLIQTLIKNQDQRQNFFQDIFPAKFGPKYNKAIQMLVEKFLIHLEKLFPVPNLKQVSCMVSDIPSLLAECVGSLSQSQEFKALLDDRKDINQLSDDDSLTVEDTICAALRLLPMQTDLTEEHNMALEKKVLTDDMDPFVKQLMVENATWTKSREDISIAIEERETNSSSVENHPSVKSDEGMEDAEVTGPSGNKMYIEDVQAAVASREDGQVKSSHRTVPESNSTAEVKHPGTQTHVQNENEEATGGTFTDKQMKIVSVSYVMPSPLLHTSAVQALRVEPPASASPRPVRKNRGLKMKSFLMMTPKNESKNGAQHSLASKTCPTCGKTYSRASDMRRHQRTHTGERPFQCKQCNKLFQFQYDLKRHEVNVCCITVQKPRSISPKIPEDGATQDPSEREAYDQLSAEPLEISRHMRSHIGAPIGERYHCSNCQNSSQQFKTSEESCPIYQKQSLSSEGGPPTTEKNDPKPCSSGVQLSKTARQKQSVFHDEDDLMMHRENASNGPGLEVVSKPHGKTCQGIQECKFCGVALSRLFLGNQKEIHPEEGPHHYTVCNECCTGVANAKKHSERCQVSTEHVDNDKEKTSKLNQRLSSSTGGENSTINELIESTSEANNCVLCDHEDTCIPAITETDVPHLSCPNCEVKFSSKTALKRHMVTVCKAKQTVCGETATDNQEGSQQDERRSSNFPKMARKGKLPDNPFYCAKCNRSFPDMARLKTHNLRHKPCPCMMCDKTFSGFEDLNRHYLDVHNFCGPFPCTFCERSYTDLKGLIRHERVHTGDLPFKCSKCPKAFSYASALKLHDRTHTKEAPFLCWDCGKGCRSNAALRIHRLCCHSSAEERRFSCEHCGKAYALKRSLDLHVAKVHAGVRYPCSHCGKLFRSASSLTRHDLTHTQERPYSCNKCSNSFRSASELKIHTRYHTGERPFKCQECGKGFVQSYYLTAHMRMHTGEKPYQCPTCEKCFKSAGILKRHQMTHTGEKPHKCSVCEMAFSRPELLKTHVRKSHNI